MVDKNKIKKQPKIDKYKKNLKDNLVELAKEEGVSQAISVCEDLVSSLETISECGGDIERFQAAALIENVHKAQREILVNKEQKNKG